ncbi:MAG: YibE/F family protein [Desulfitobacteriia bacterium]|jgi:uncharacterized membrane protein
MKYAARLNPRNDNNAVSNKLIICLMIITVLISLFASPLRLIAQEEEQLPLEEPQTVRGKVLEITEDNSFAQEFPDGMGDDYDIIYYQVKLKVLSGLHRGEVITAQHVEDERMVYNLHIEEGDEVLIYLEEDEEGQILNAYIAEIYRQKYLAYLVLLFLITLLAVGSFKGLKTIITLVITGLAVIKLLLPGLLAGYSPIPLTVAICAGVTALTLFIISGVNKKTFAAIIGTTGGVIVAGIIAFIFGSLAKITGLGEQEAQMLTFIPQNTGFDFEGLLFAGIILGALGAVMDVGMSVASAMNEIAIVKPDISTKELIRAGMNVGRDMMGTMSNTLILAYTGASMPLLLLFLAHEIPFGEFINWDMISSEVVRTFAGSIGLILTIPLTVLTSIAFRNGKSCE